MSDSSGTSSSDLDPFVTFEKFEIANVLNVSMFVALLMGIYTIIYGWSMYVCFARGLSNRYIVPATTFSALYLCNLIQFSISWWILKWQFVDNGDDRNSIYASLSSVPLRFTIVLNVLFIISLLLGDALLIWRCFLVWNGLYLVIFIPILLIVIDTLMLLVSTIGSAITWSEFNIAMLLKFNRLAMAGFIIATFIPVILQLNS